MLLETVLEASARRTPGKTALVCGSTRLTYAELEASANQLAHALLELQVQAGERVVVCLENVAECVVAIFGVLKAGAVLVVVNPTIKSDKLALVLADSGASVLLLAERKLLQVEAALGQPQLRSIVTVGDALPASRAAGPAASPGPARWSWAELLRDRPATGVPKRAIDQDLAFLLYTSGSTGAPKGVMHTHQSMLSVTRSIAEYLGSDERDVVLSVLPLSFGYGLTQLLPTFLVGGTLVLERSFTFPQNTLQRLAAEKATGFAMVPTIATILLGYDLGKLDCSSLRYLTNAGAGIPPALLRELRQRLPWVRIFPMYGQTECIRVTYLPPEEVDRNPTSVGRGIPNQELWLADDEGRRLPLGSTGELVVRGAHVMRGYWNLPEATAAKLRDGRLPGERVLHTGDLFRTDADGWFYFVSRKDDIIKTRGEKVSPREVENVLYALPGVQAAAVVGLPDPVLGESVVAFVVRKPGADFDAKSVLRHCQDHLEDFAVPKRIEFLDELPTTPNAKIDKQALRLRCNLT